MSLVVLLGEPHVLQELGVHPFKTRALQILGPLDSIAMVFTTVVMTGVIL